MNFKTSVLWAVLAVCCLGSLVGCKPTDKKTPDQPSPNTTDSK